MLKKELLDILACPVCKSELTYDESAQTLTCKACSLVYPIRDGIPVMLESEATKLGSTGD